MSGRLVPTISDLKNVINAQGGANHSIFLTSQKEVFTTGGNQFGQLGTSDLVDRMIPTQIAVSGVNSISAGQYTSLVLRHDNSVYGFGNNTEEQLSSTNELKIPELPVFKYLKSNDPVVPNPCKFAEVIKLEGLELA